LGEGGEKGKGRPKTVHGGGKAFGERMRGSGSKVDGSQRDKEVI